VALRELALAISDADSADQAIDARLELYTLDTHASESSEMSPRHQQKSPKQLMNHFVTALSETFPDYKFDGLSQDSFAKRDDLNAILSAPDFTTDAAVGPSASVRKSSSGCASK